MNLKIAVLCYHSWNIKTSLLMEDVDNLREKGWQGISLSELIAILDGKGPAKGKLFHVTNDDGSLMDEKFSEALEKLDCPATFFIATGIIPNDRLNYYRRLDQGGLISVEDHSLYHRKGFRGPRLVEFFSEHSLSTGLEPLGLLKGMPIVEFGGELGGRLFRISEEANSLCRERARYTDFSDPGSIKIELIQPLLKKGFAYQKAGRTYLKGDYEEGGDFKSRITGSLSSGKKNFENMFHRPPKAFCFPFYDASRWTRQCLTRLGYLLQFGGGAEFWNGRSSYVPRFSIEALTQRPLDLDGHRQNVFSPVSLLKKFRRLFA